MPSTPIAPRRQSSISSSTSCHPPDNRGSRPSIPHIHPNFLPMIRRLRARLIPLISCTTGEIPPQFPPNLLAYHLLTSAQLDELARDFHQVWPPVQQTSCYPIQIPAWIGTPQEAAVDLETKRRRFGRFIGLRDCESPTGTNDAAFFDEPRGFDTDKLVQMEVWEPLHAIFEEPVHIDPDEEVETVAQMLERMEREWQEALQQAHEEQGNRFVGKQ
ncbi:uncharacterized protein N7459_002176 [Penicillium hispanicum]|uniref:uncharacterized protein n=1 Tax=Penicillium hispanicum TaxID=1080232 RepID=UPI002542631C|nr:uncharacterized protein N7459_002176 [Penicillium hispanicum]KAJ5591807.1 hypothetical protein N7459_002176 [Penicillium hispanicum]